MKKFGSGLLSKLNKLLDTSGFAWLVCIEVQKGEAFYLTTHDQIISVYGHDWLPFPMELGEQRASGDGDLTSASLTISNIGRIAMPYLESGAWDQGVVVFIPVYAKDPDAHQIPIRLRYYINNASADDQAVTLNIGQRNVFSRPYPPRSYIRANGFPGIVRSNVFR